MSAFWHWLRNLSNEKIKAEHSHSRKCERCRLWTSEVGGAKSVGADPADVWVELMRCRWCGHESRWDMRYMIPILIPNDSYNIPEKQDGKGKSK